MLHTSIRKISRQVIKEKVLEEMRIPFSDDDNHPLEMENDGKAGRKKKDPFNLNYDSFPFFVLLSFSLRGNLTDHYYRAPSVHAFSSFSVYLKET